MNEDRQKVLRMLSEGKINVEEAERLLNALGGANGATATKPAAEPTAGSRPKFLRVQVDGEQMGQAKVDIRVPLALVRAGVRLGSLIPKNAQENVNRALAAHGISLDINQFDAKTLDELIDGLGELEVNLNQGPNKVRIFCE